MTTGSKSQLNDVHFRVANEDDLTSIVRLLADDLLGAKREAFSEPLPSFYTEAFEAIDTDPNNELLVATDDRSIIGVLQLTYIPNLTHRGSWRAMIEGVRIASAYRSSGLGTELLKWTIERSRARGCRVIQLTSDLQRTEAIAFYERLGFQYTHAGMKLWLDK